MVDNDDYEVGRGSPPRSTRFKKGQSGNPRGRPKVAMDPLSAFDRAAREMVFVNDNGQRKPKAKIEIAFVQLLNQAAQGDKSAAAQLLGWVRLGYQRQAPEATELPLDEDDQRVIASLVERILKAHADRSLDVAPAPADNPVSTPEKD